MFRAGRELDPIFGDDELLFSRFVGEHLVDGVLSPSAVKFPRASVNRSLFGPADDVLWHHLDDTRYDGYGVFEFSVAALRSLRLEAGDRRISVLEPEHEPLEKNYAHSVLLCLRAEDREQVKNPGNLIQKKFRTELSRRIEVRIEAAAP